MYFVCMSLYLPLPPLPPFHVCFCDVHWMSSPLATVISPLIVEMSVQPHVVCVVCVHPFPPSPSSLWCRPNITPSNSIYSALTPSHWWCCINNEIYIWVSYTTIWLVSYIHLHCSSVTGSILGCMWFKQDKLFLVQVWLVLKPNVALPNMDGGKACLRMRSPWSQALPSKTGGLLHSQLEERAWEWGLCLATFLSCISPVCYSYQVGHTVVSTNQKWESIKWFYHKISSMKRDIITKGIYQSI